MENFLCKCSYASLAKRVIFLALFGYFVVKVITAVEKLEAKGRINVSRMPLNGLETIF